MKESRSIGQKVRRIPKKTNKERKRSLDETVEKQFISKPNQSV